ncbi:unnamed protein product [Penicillium salamii]|uniref:Uncharacterized protein n=1 Tax=Penicillium salamii TaxID=1612424 RepID=A0A9W4JUD4_9EURO|nr:unnamed protein product [Penicillium salamii]CAG8222775.1 unnamed protein product [Penicillium salamii]CAG8285184.1 unnamed protein product [Penicillium salamii]CAG8392761.1 unnamed protein product [Penicillium salamii]CAG8418027.1 unnamed protein product [Penicillium salamii]
MINLSAIVEAIQILSRLDTISTQDLIPYRSTLEQTLRIIEKKLDTIPSESSRSETSLQHFSQQPTPATPITCSGSFACSGTSCATHSSVEETGENNDTTEEASEALDVQRLMGALHGARRSEKVFKYLSSQSDPLAQNGDDWVQEDPRVVDIRLCNRGCSLDACFRRGLGQRSLAMEFDEWEREVFGTSRVSRRSLDPKAIDDNIGLINRFLAQNSVPFRNKESASHGIRDGIRLLVFERIYGHVGVSAILILLFTLFREVKYGSFAALKRLLQETGAWHNLAKDKSSWLTACQIRYDARHTMWQKFQGTLGCEISGILPHTIPTQLTALGNPRNHEQMRGYLNPGLTISRNGFNLHQLDPYSHDRRQRLIEHDTISTSQAPRERSVPLAISELINQDSEPRPLTHSRNTETDMSSARSNSIEAAAYLTRQIQPVFEHESAVLELRTRYDVDQAPPNFNQCDFGTIRPLSQDETVDMDLCAQFGPGRIPPVFNQFDYGTIPSVSHDETVDMDLCAQLDAGHPPVFNQFDYGTIPSVSHDETVDMDLCAQLDAGHPPVFIPSYGTVSSTTQNEDQSEGLRNNDSNFPYRQRPMLSVF